MASGTVSKTSVDNIASVITNKRSRSLLFLITTFVLILLANGFLPLLSGQAHYTVNPVEVTYAEYIVMKKNDELVDLTYGAKVKIEVYKDLYKVANPDLDPTEITLLEPPPQMKVKVYTQFFFESAWWYFGTGLSLVSAVFLFYALFNFFIVKAKDTQYSYMNGEYTIKQLNERYLDPDTFETWMEKDFNKQRKIKQHIRNTKYELKKLETATPYVIRRRFKHHVVIEVADNNLLPVIYKPLTKEERKYLDKKEELLDKLDERYIEDYVVDNDVDNFKEIKPGFVYSGVNVEGVGQDEFSNIKTDKQRIKGSMLSKILVSLSITLAFASVLTVLAVSIEEQNSFWLFLSVLMKIVPLGLQLYFALDYTNWFMENQLLPNLKFRENIAMMYLAEMKRRGIVTQPVTINKIVLEEAPKGEKT